MRRGIGKTLFGIALLWMGFVLAEVAAERKNLEPVPANARVALVIGNERYQNGINPLRNPVADARAMAMALRSIGFEVVERVATGGATENLGRRDLLDAVSQFAERARGAQIALLYYSGHGLSLGQENFLVPVDARPPTSDAMLRTDNVALSELLAMLGEKERRLNVVILDACRDNPLPKLGKSVSVGRGLQATEPAQGNLIMYAAGEGQVALDRLSPTDSDPNGVFTRVLLREIVRPRVEVYEAFTAVRTKVQELAARVNHRQRPAIYDNKEGKFYFVSAPGASIEAQVTNPAPADVPPIDVRRVFRDCPECPEMVVIPAGEFVMGSRASEEGRDSDEGPQHRVRIGSKFAVGKTEVTFKEWDACVAAGGCRHRPDDHGWGRGTQPVIEVSWQDAQEYVGWLAKRTGKGYRLLSEAEWEYAARAGSATAYPWGDAPGTNNANFVGSGSTWRGKPAPVGSFAANAFGLHDMIGNVWEWVQDCYQGSYAGAPSDGSAWEAGKCEARVLRGGSWFDKPLLVRSAIRIRSTPSSRGNLTGFRVARTLP